MTRYPTQGSGAEGPDRAPERERGRGVASDWRREVIDLPHGKGVYWPAARVTSAIVIPLAVTLALGRPDWSAYAVFAAIAAVYGKRGTPRTRLHAQLGAGGLLIASMWVGICIAAANLHYATASALIGLVSLVGYLVAHRCAWRPVPSLFLVFTAGTIASQPHTWHDLLISAVVGASAVAFAIGVNAIPFGGPAGQPPATQPKGLTSRGPLPGETVETALLHALAPTGAALLAFTAGLGHPYWAAVSAVVPIAAVGIGSRLGRATARLAGTLLGVLLTWAFLLTGAPVWVCVAVIAACQFHTEVFVARNYAIAVVGITPMALLLIHILAPPSSSPILLDRVLQTMLGLGVTTALMLVTLGVNALYRGLKTRAADR